MSQTPRGFRPYRLPLLAFGGVWLLAVLVLASRGLWSWVGGAVGEAAGLGLFVWLTFRMTGGRPALPESDESTASPAGPEGEARPADETGTGAGAARDDEARPAARARLVAQLVVALTLAGLTIIRYADIPVWGTFVRTAYRAAEALSGTNPNYLMNPLLYVVLPGAAVLLLGATWRGIGFRAGWRSWRTIAVWSVPAVVAWAYYLISGAAGIVRIAGTVASNAVLNGFSEEFLWRGVIQTRIGQLWTPEWGLVLASLGFGWWHIDSIHDWAGNDLLVTASLNVTVQATMGLALGVIFDRTRNLLAPSVVHAVLNSIEV